MEFKENLIWIKLGIFQEDCPISLISSELNSQIEIINTFIDYNQKKEVYIKFKDNKLLTSLYNNEYFIKKFKLQVKLIKSTSVEKILNITANNTEMSNIYNNYLIKCVRIYPVKVINGEETWNLLCENKKYMENLIDQIKKSKYTKINSYKFYNLTELINNIEYAFKYPILNNLLLKFDKISSHEKEILLYAFKNKYYENNIYIDDIAKYFNVSKSYISKTLKKNERELLKIILNFIFNLNSNF